MAHGDALVTHVMQRQGISRRRARKLLAALARAQWIEVSGSIRRPHFKPGPLRHVVRHYALAGLQEDLPWAQDFAPMFDWPPNVAKLVQHAFTELLNNAAEHSGGSGVTVSIRQTGLHVQMLVSDDGCGIFDRIEQTWQIADPGLAMFELSKGKLTSQPDRHCGHGLYFAARCADIFDLHANRRAFQRRAGQHPWASLRPLERGGTSVYLAIALDTTRSLDAVLRSQAEQGYAFEQTEVPMALLTGPQVDLGSRAQARRVCARLTQFKRACLDFQGIDDVGPAFADELFRVFRRDHPAVELIPQNMSPRVAAMIASVS